MVSIVLASDFELFRDGLRSLLDAHGYTTVLQLRTRELNDSAIEWNGSLLVLDLDQPDPQLTTLKAVLAEHPMVTVVAISRCSDIDLVLGAVGYGVRGYVTRDSSSSELLAVIERALAGGIAFSADLSPALCRQASHTIANQLNDSQRSLGLSRREIQILEMITAGSSVSQMAASLYVSKKTVQNNISSIYRKLGVEGRAEAVVMAVELGLNRKRG